MKYVLLLAALAPFAAGTAQAQTTGAHVDAELGWSRQRVPDQTGSTTVTPSDDRLIYGGGAGYDVALGGGWIAGVDSHLDLGATRGCESSVLVAGDRSCDKMVRDFDVGARIGFKAGPALLYGRAAYDNELLRSSYLAAAGATEVRDSNAHSGVRLGAGVEIPLTQNVYASGEYRWTDYAHEPDQNQLLAGIGIRF